VAAEKHPRQVQVVHRLVGVDQRAERTGLRLARVAAAAPVAFNRLTAATVPAASRSPAGAGITTASHNRLMLAPLVTYRHRLVTLEIDHR
jgi:hypothetical protein